MSLELDSPAASRSFAESPGVTMPSSPDGRQGFLSDLLVELGYVDEAAAADAVDQGRLVNKVPETILIDTGAITEEHVAMATAERHGLPYVDLTKFEIDREAPNLIGVDTARRYRAAPIAFDSDSVLIVALADPLDVLAVSDIGVITKSEVRPVVATESAIEALVATMPPRPVARLAPERLDVEEMAADGAWTLSGAISTAEAEPTEPEPEPDPEARPIPPLLGVQAEAEEPKADVQPQEDQEDEEMSRSAEMEAEELRALAELQRYASEADSAEPSQAVVAPDPEPPARPFEPLVEFDEIFAPEEQAPADDAEARPFSLSPEEAAELEAEVAEAEAEVAEVHVEEVVHEPVVVEPVASEPEPSAFDPVVVRPLAAAPDPEAVEPEPEPILAAVEPEVEVVIEPEPVAVEPEPIVEIAAEPVEIEPEPELEPVAVTEEPVVIEPEPEPVVDAALEPVVEPAPVAIQPEPVAPRAPNPLHDRIADMVSAALDDVALKEVDRLEAELNEGRAALAASESQVGTLSKRVDKLERKVGELKEQRDRYRAECEELREAASVSASERDAERERHAESERRLRERVAAANGASSGLQASLAELEAAIAGARQAADEVAAAHAAVDEA